MSGGGSIDSFNSSDPTRSTGSLYDLAKRQSNGRVATNDTQGASDLKDTFVYGDLGWSGSYAVRNTSNVQGSMTNGFSSTIDVVVAPVCSSYNFSPTIINNSTTLTGAAKAAPEGVM